MKAEVLVGQSAEFDFRLLWQSTFHCLPANSCWPARVTNQQRTLRSFAISCLKKGGALSEVPACRGMGLRAFGRGLPIGDSLGFVSDLDNAGYWQNYQSISREQLWALAAVLGS